VARKPATPSVNLSLNNTPRIAASSSTPDKCPQCGSSDIRKVSAVYAENCWHESKIGTVDTVGYIDDVGPTFSSGVTKSSGKGATQLGFSLSPPPPPTRAKSSKSALFATVAAATAFSLFGCILTLPTLSDTSSAEARRNSFGSFSLWVSIALGGAALSVVTLRSARQDEERLDQEHFLALGTHQYQTAVWDRCYYCKKCDTVSDPSTSRTVPTSAFSALVYGPQFRALP